MSLPRYRDILWIVAALQLAGSPLAAGQTSGDLVIDQARQQVVAAHTDESNYQRRALLLYNWLGALQQQGADTRSFFEIDRAYYREEAEVARAPSDTHRKSLVAQLAHTIDSGYAAMERIQEELATSGPIANARQATPTGRPPQGDWQAEWPMFQGNIHHTGHSSAPGPRFGKLAWQFPVGLGWYARPVIEENSVYISAPGMRVTSLCLDVSTGKEIWSSEQAHPLLGIYKYPAIASSPIVRKDDIILREVNSHGGNEGQAKNLVFLNKKTGAVRARQYAGHIDYRTQYAPVAASEEFIVYPFGVHDIYGSPPVCQNFNRLICADSENTRRFWDVNIGDIDALAEPVIANGRAFCGTMEGYLYALKLGAGRREEVVAWSAQVDGAINTAVLVHDGKVFFGSNGGTIYCLNEQDGEIIWSLKIPDIQAGARKQFSVPILSDGRLYIGSANSKLYCIGSDTGSIRWTQTLSDWIRAKPGLLGSTLVVATVDGNVHGLSHEGKVLWQKKISSHPFYADLASNDTHLVACDSNLMTFCLSPEGALIWQRSILPAWNDPDGNRILTDQLSGGTYYQSKPTAYRGRIYFGTPSGFLFALDARTGRELWKFEMGGAISVGPACANGKVYAGQQGGERFFYCLDSESGERVWQQTLPGGWVWGSASVDENRVYVPTVNGYAVCLDAQTGHIIWMYPTAKSVPAEPAIEGDLVYFGSWSRSLYAFDKRTGELRWKQNGVQLDSGTLIASGNRIFVPNHVNIFSSFDARTGRLLSTGNDDAAAKGVFSDFNATPAFHDGRAFFSARGGIGLRGVPLFSTVYCVDTHTSKILWTHFDGGGLSAPAIANGRVYIASGNSPFLYCLDEVSGSPHWVFKLGNRVEEATLCLYQDRVFVLSADGYLRAIE